MASRRTISPTVLTLTIIFSLPFAFIGLYAVMLSRRGTGDSLLLLILGTLFAITGIALIAGVIVQRIRLSRLASLRKEHPNDPWMVNPAWRTNRIVSRSRSTSTGNLIAAILITFALSAACAFAIWIEWPKGNHAVLWSLFMPAIALLFLKSSAEHFISAMRYGDSVLVLDKLPVPIGGDLRGRIETHVPRERLAAATSIGATLRGENTRVTGTSSNRSTSTVPVAMDMAQIDTSAVLAGPTGATIPIAFRIAVNAPPTDDSDPDNTISWKLSVTAEMPGIDYSAEFDVPVFPT